MERKISWSFSCFSDMSGGVDFATYGCCWAGPRMKLKVFFYYCELWLKPIALLAPQRKVMFILRDPLTF